MKNKREKDIIDQIIDSNKDLVELQEQKADLLPKVCDSCGQDLTDWENCYDPKQSRKHQYITMMSIADDVNGGIGGLSYTCHTCLDHMNKYHKPEEECGFSGGCELSMYQKLKRKFN